MSKRERLQDLQQLFETENECLLKEAAIQAVYGDGNPSAKVVFIGEAPGKKEDLTGKPFVGASGKFLDEMLASINMKRQDIYITNIVKYRPPENRDPTNKEIASCEAWLHAELAFIQPRLIVTLGRYALNHFIPSVSIGEAHGQFFQKDIPGLGCFTFFALYHPAAALYNGSLRETLKKDFQKIALFLKESSST